MTLVLWVPHVATEARRHCCSSSDVPNPARDARAFMRPDSPARISRISQGRRKTASMRRQFEVHPDMTLTGVRDAGQETMGSTWRGVNTTRGASS